MATYDPKSSGSQGMMNTPASSEGVNPTTSTGSLADTTQESTGGAIDTVKQTTGQAVDKAKQVAAPAVDQAKQVAGTVVDQAKQTATSQLTDQKDMAAESLGTVADTLRQTSRELRGGQGQAFAGVATAAADQIETLSTYLRDRDVTDLVRDVENFARRQPILFLSGAFALGLLGARFLKSSSANLNESYDTYDTYGARGSYGTGGGYGTSGAYGAGSSYGTSGAYGVGSGYGTTGAYRSGATYSSGSAYGREMDAEPREGYRQTYQGYVEEDTFEAPRYQANEGLRPSSTNEE